MPGSSNTSVLALLLLDRLLPDRLLLLLTDSLQPRCWLPPVFLPAHAASQAVDKFVTAGMIGCIYQPILGSQLGTCAATNMLTMQQEAPPDHHWHHVAQLLKLTQVQLQQLAAGYQAFIHDRRVQHRAQLAVAQVVDNSCSLQLLAAARQATAADGSCAAWETAAEPVVTSLACLVLSSARTLGDGADTGAAAAAATGTGVPGGSASQCTSSLGSLLYTPSCLGSMDHPAGISTPACPAAAMGHAAGEAPAQQATSTRSAAGSQPGRHGAAASAAAAAAATAADAAAAAAEQAEPAGGDPISMVEGFMKMLHRSSLSLHLLLFNTLTRRQIARLVIACYPFLPRAAPLMEAAISGMQPSDWMLDEQGPEAAAAAAAAAAVAREDQLAWMHSRQRAALLREQCCRWWSE